MGYVQATSLQEAFAAMAQGASVIAGGTDWYPSRGDGPMPDHILDVNRLPGFRTISQDAVGWRIGAAMRWRDVIDARLPPAFDGLKAAAREVGSVQIQNAGTIAGNLCNASPAADGVPPLLTLDAQIEITNPAGRRLVPMAAFITGVRETILAPGELVSAIVVPTPPAGTGSSFLKLGARKYLVISIVMVAVALRLQKGMIADARVAVGACSAVATRLPDLETALAGCDPDDCAQVLDADRFAPLTPISDVRSSADFRRDAVQEICARAISMAARSAREAADG